MHRHFILIVAFAGHRDIGFSLINIVCPCQRVVNILLQLNTTTFFIGDRRERTYLTARIIHRL